MRTVAEENTYRNALPLDTMLLEYRLESVLGAGGFGITYLGRDTHLDKPVAIKEYLPGELAIRALDGSVVPVNTELEYNYKWGLERFIQEARTLARFSHPNIVHLNRYFEANGTSYMVMDYEAGQSLYQSLKRAPAPDEAALKAILLPILDGLEAVHRAGFLHRDIKPSNVFIRENGTPVLLDFGSARLAAGRASKNLTAIVSPGYAPLEQYSADGNQGPWSDIYALSGVVYRAVTGENPPDVVKRMKADSVPAALAAARTRFSERFLKAVEWGMMLDEKMRPQSVAEWRELFTGRMPMTALSRGVPAAPTRRVSTAAPTAIEAAGATAPKAPDAPTVARSAATKVLTPRRWKWMRRVTLLVVVAIATAVFFRQRAIERELKAQAAAQSQTAADLERKVTQRIESADRDRGGNPGQAEPAAAPQAAPAMPQNAQEEQRPAERGEETQVPPRLRQEFDAADLNGDGYLTPDEVRGKLPFIAKNFALIDTDHDGRISPLEFWQLRVKQQALKARR